MIFDGLISDKAYLISAALAELQKLPEVETAVLCTSDGLAIDGQTPEQIAAVASFLVASVKQASAILGRRRKAQEVTIRLGNNSSLVCWPFTAGEATLIIAAIFNQGIAYKRLLKQTAQSIQEAVED
jgi:predicted regulator of Ras-like GTPase activity (Roadblock/LC7/MglB family)